MYILYVHTYLYMMISCQGFTYISGGWDPGYDSPLGRKVIPRQYIHTYNVLHMRDVEFAQCTLSPIKLCLALYPFSLMYVYVALCSSSSIPVLPFAHLALYPFCNSPLCQVFLENPLLIRPFCTVLCQSYILLSFLNGFYYMDAAQVKPSLFPRQVCFCISSNASLFFELDLFFSLKTHDRNLLI